MTLLLPAPPAFGYFVTNEDSPTGGAYGVQVTCGAADTKGSWVAIHATITYDLYLHTFTFTEANVSAAATNVFVDLGIGPDASNVTVIAENIVACNAAPHTQGGRVCHSWPLYVPAGTQLWTRAQSSTASKTLRVHAASWGGPDHPESFPKIGYIESLGENTASTTGTAITPGASGAVGTFVSLGSFTNDVCAVSLICSSDDSSLTASSNYIGALGTDATATIQDLGICNDHKNLGSSESVRSNTSVIWYEIPAGQAMAARMTCSSGTVDSTMWGVGYGFVRG